MKQYMSNVVSLIQLVKQAKPKQNRKINARKYFDVKTLKKQGKPKK